MTYLQILNLIKETALAQPNVNTVVREFIDLNREDTKYSAVVIQDRDGTRNRIIEQDYITYTWHLGFVDRLTYDESNRDDIFSTGINVINNIVNSIRNTYFPSLEVRVIDRFNTFNQRFTASCAGVYVVLAIDVQVPECVDGEQADMYDKYEGRFNENGHYHIVPDGRPIDEIDITVDVETAKPEEHLIETITSNGVHNFWPSTGSVFSDASITVEVPEKEEEDIYIQIINNGVDTWIPESGKVWKKVMTDVNVHPSVSLSETYTSNGVYNINGEFSGGTVAVSVPEAKPEDGIEIHIINNGVETWTPESGKVWNRVVTEVDVHPSVSLSETYTSNGVYNINGEFSGGTVAVSVPMPNIYDAGTVSVSENGSYGWSADAGTGWNHFGVDVDVHPSTSLVETITSNGTTSFSGEWKDATISVDVHPSNTLSRTYTTNGSKTITGEFNGGTVKVNVHPSTSLVETITSNGTTSFSGEWKNADITVAVPTTVTVSMSQDAYNNLSVKDPNTIYLIIG